MKEIKYFLLGIILCMGTVLTSCRDKDKSGNYLDTPTSGKIQIAVDESLRPLLEAQVSTFEGIYQNSSIKANYVSEGEAIQALLNDSVRLAVVCRELTAEENEVMKTQKLTAHTVKIAVDAIALVVNPANLDSTLTYEQADSLLSGEIKSWKSISGKPGLSDIRIVFDKNNSSTVRFIKEKMVGSDTLPPNCFAVDSNPKVIDYITSEKNALGVIGVSWISDRDDTLSRSFLKKVKVLGISMPDTVKAEKEFNQPYQSYLALKTYPLMRNVYIISREARAGLGSGFIAFVAGDQGQRIVLKSGILPATQPIRIVEFKNKP